MTLQKLEHFVALEDLYSTVDRLSRAKSNNNSNQLRVLEAGCGSLCHINLENNYHITGIDISQKQLDRNTQLQKAILGDIQTYSFEKNSFDIIVCFWVLEHVDNPTLALNNFKSALRDDGILIIGVPNVMSMKGLVTKLTPHWFHVFIYRYIFKYSLAGTGENPPFLTTIRLSISPESVLQFAKENGFSVIYFNKFEDYRQEELRHKLKLVGRLWSITKDAVKAITFGNVDADATSYAVVLQKNRLTASA